MDELFSTNANTMFTERYGFLITKFRTENDRNKAFFKRMEAERKQLLAIFSGDVLKQLDNYIELLSTYKDTEGKYIYAQGVKDCIHLYRFLDTDFINADYDDLLPDDKIPSVTTNKGDDNLC